MPPIARLLGLQPSLVRCRAPHFHVLICAVATLVFYGCGGGGGGSTPGGGGGSNSADYALTLSAASVSLASGSPQVVTVTVQGTNGFNGLVTGSVTGLPTGVLATPATFTINGSGSQQIQLSLTQAAQSGTTSVTVNTSSGALSHQTQFGLAVNAGPPGLSVSAPASITLDPGTQQLVEVKIAGTGGYSGQVSGTVTGLPVGVTVNSPTFTTSTGNSTFLYFTAASNASTSATVTITVTSGTYSASAQLPVSVVTTPDFQISVGNNSALILYQDSKSTIELTTAAYNGFSQPISFTFSGLPTGITVSPSSFTLQPGSTQRLTFTASFSAAITNDTKFTLTASGGGITRQVVFTLIVIAPSISLDIQPNSVSVPAGSMTSFRIQALIASFSPIGDTTVQFSNVPKGITLHPASLTFQRGGGVQSVLVEAGNDAASGTLTITASYGSVQKTATLPIKVGPSDSFTPMPRTTADNFVRTDSITPFTSFPPATYLIYHGATKRFFSTDAYLDRVNVIDSTTQTLVATLTVPGAFGIDQAPDGSVLYVGTMLGDLYVIDPVGLKVLKRYPSTAISPYGFAANAVYAMANGKLLLVSYFLVQAFSWIDGNGPIALWDPATNDITIFGGPSASDPERPVKPGCFERFQDVKLTNNRTRVMLSPVQSSEGSSYLCSLDPETGTSNWSAHLSGGSGGAFTAYALTSDGGTLYAFDGYGVHKLNAATLEELGSFPVTTRQALLDYPTMFLSRDDKKLFITDGAGKDVLDVYDTSSGQLIGWMPQLNLAAVGSYSHDSPLYQAMDANGVAAGVINAEGVGFIDSNAVHNLPIGSRFMQTQLSLPYGPLEGGTAESWLPSVWGIPVTPLGSIYFGGNAATDLGNNTFSGPSLFATTPAGKAGPVDVRTFSTDGGSQLIPEGFSYGPWILEAPTNYSTAEGGGPASLYGYGFAPPAYTSGATYLPAPLDLQVSIGGVGAPVTSYSPDPYRNLAYPFYFTAPPLPKTSLLYTIPAGTTGTTATISVSNASGSTTATTKLTYLPSVQQYPLDGQLVDGIYDPHRDVYYFSDVNRVRVFSLKQSAWLSPIDIPAAYGAYGPQRLWGLALSPDGSKLAVSDPGAIAIYIIDPDHPSSIQSFPYASQFFGDPITAEPAGLAITDAGTVYFVTFDLGGDGGRGYLFSLNPSTGKITEIMGDSGIGIPNYLPTEGPDPDSRLAITADGSRIYFNDDGELGYIDTAQGFFYALPNNAWAFSPGGYELVLAGNQTRLFGSGYLMDSNVNPIGLQALDLAQVLDATYVYGAALSADGNLLFQPGLQFIDVFDGQTGAFRARVALPMQLSANYRALVSNNRDNRLVAITGSGNGIAVVDLNSMPEPEPLPYFSVASSRVNPAAQQYRLRTARARQLSKTKSTMPVVHQRSRRLLPSRIVFATRAGIQ